MIHDHHPHQGSPVDIWTGAFSVLASSGTYLFGQVFPVFAQGVVSELAHILMSGVAFVLVAIGGRMAVARYDLSRAERRAKMAETRYDEVFADLVATKAELQILKERQA